MSGSEWIFTQGSATESWSTDVFVCNRSRRRGSVVNRGLVAGLRDGRGVTDREYAISTSLGLESRRVVPWNMASSWSVGDPPEGFGFDNSECCSLVFVFVFVPIPVLLRRPFPFPRWEEEVFFNVPRVYVDFDVTEDAAELPSQLSLNIPVLAGLIVPRFACLGWRSTRRLAPGCDITQKTVCEGLVYRYWLPVDIVWSGGAVFFAL